MPTLKRRLPSTHAPSLPRFVREQLASFTKEGTVASNAPACRQPSEGSPRKRTTLVNWPSPRFPRTSRKAPTRRSRLPQHLIRGSKNEPRIGVGRVERNRSLARLRCLLERTAIERRAAVVLLLCGSSRGGSSNLGPARVDLRLGHLDRESRRHRGRRLRVHRGEGRAFCAFPGQASPTRTAAATQSSTAIASAIFTMPWKRRRCTGSPGRSSSGSSGPSGPSANIGGAASGSRDGIGSAASGSADGIGGAASCAMPSKRTGITCVTTRFSSSATMAVTDTAAGRAWPRGALPVNRVE
jgi:hypothetical protein